MLRNVLILVVSFLIVLTAFVWTENEITPSFQSCIRQTASDQSDETTQNKSPVIFVSRQAICSLRLIDRHNGFFAALAAIAVAAFTGTLWLATYRLGVAGERQIDTLKQLAAIAKAQHIAAHRPHLIVRQVEIDSVHSPDFTVMFTHGAKIRGRLTVVNAGGSTAHIVKSEHGIFALKPGLPIRPPYDTLSPDLLKVGESFSVGETIICKISDTLVMPFDERLGRPTHQFSDEGWSLYVMGRISYMDDGGAERFMAFCRKRESDGRFIAVKDPDYEYED